MKVLKNGIACACVHCIQLHMASNILSGKAKRRPTTKEQNLTATTNENPEVLRVTQTKQARTLSWHTHYDSKHSIFQLHRMMSSYSARCSLLTAHSIFCCFFFFFPSFSHCTLVLIIYRLFNAFKFLVYCYYL